MTARATPVTTPGTRVTFSDVRGWMDGYLRIHRRPPATQRHVQLRAHVAVLTRELIAQEDDPEVLEALRDLFQEPRAGLKPSRGARQGSAYELAVTAVHDRLVALRRPASRPYPWAPAPCHLRASHGQDAAHPDHQGVALVLHPHKCSGQPGAKGDGDDQIGSINRH